MLLREHLGGRQQRGLAAGVDDAQHRAEGDERLAGADLALEQPVHRVRLGEVVRDLLADLALPVGQRERQPLVERHLERPVAAGARGRAELAERPAAAGEHELGDQGLLEPEPVLRPRHLVPPVGGVDPVEGGEHVEHVVRLAHAGGEQLGDRRRPAPAPPAPRG